MRDYRPTVSDGDRIRAELALRMVAATTGVPADQMLAGERLALRACRARWMALYLSHVGYGWPLERVGHAFGLNRATVGAACRWAEDERDRPLFDATLERMERCLRDLLDAPRCEIAV